MSGIVIVNGGGRLGNQIFQYAFLKTLFPTSQKIISIRMKDIPKLFEVEDEIINIEGLNVYRVAKVLLKSISPFFSYYEQKFDKTHLPEVIYKKGIFKNPVIINFGYYQSEKFFSPKIKEKLKIKKEYLDKAKKILEPFSDKELVFVHIRRGDYVNLGGSLPKSYYEKGIKYFQDKLKNPFFVFLSDDIEWVKNNFKLDNAYYSNNDMFVDFTLMTLCEYGVMSNSTFSYWGGYLMQNRKEVISPKYWLGFKEKRYSPIGIKPSFTKEIEVDY
jgi:hypothetical protein